MQRLHRLLDRRAWVPAVDLVEVDVVETKPLQRGVNGGEDVLTGETGTVHAGHRPAVHLRRDHVLLARREQLLQQAAGDHFALAAVVDVCGVEEDDSALDRPAHDRLGGLFVERPGPLLAAAVAHHPEADSRDAQAGPAETDVIHSGTLPSHEAPSAYQRVDTPSASTRAAESLMPAHLDQRGSSILGQG